MSNLNPDGATPPNRTRPFSTLPQCSWVSVGLPPRTPELYSQYPGFQQPQAPHASGHGSSLLNPLTGLPPYPTTQLSTTEQYHHHPQYSSTPTLDSFLTFSRSLHTPDVRTTGPPPHPEHSFRLESYPPPLQTAVSSSPYQQPNPPFNYIPSHVQQQWRSEDIQPGGWSQNALPNLRSQEVSRDVTTDSYSNPDETLAEASEVIGGDGTVVRAPRKRGRPKLLDVEGQPKKRRKRGTGRPGGWSKGLKIGPRPAMEPGAEYVQLLTQAADALFEAEEGQIEKALELALKAVTLNPEIYMAHGLLAQIYIKLNDEEKAIAALFSGAHAMPTDPDVWFQAAEACLTRYKGKRETALQQARYCCSRIIQIGSASERHTEARLLRVSIDRELNNFSKAMKGLELILKDMPRNSDVLEMIAQVCIDTRDLKGARKIYEDTIAFYKENGFEDDDSFTWHDVLSYTQVLALEEPPELGIANALKVLKQLSRWLIGREDETYWDQVEEDDREFDPEDVPRRILVPEFVPGRHEPESYGTALPLQIRVRMGIFRLKQGPETLNEALDHFEWLAPEVRGEDAYVHDFPDLFLEVAEALLETREYTQALRYFEALKDTNSYSHPEFWLGIGAAFSMCGNKLKAFECYEEARQEDEEGVDAWTQLSKLYATFGDKENAIEHARQAIRLAESLVPETGKRKYEPKEIRLIREEAEDALKEALQLPGKYTGGTPIERIESKLTVAGRSRFRTRQPLQHPPRKDLARNKNNGNQLKDIMEYVDDLGPGNEGEMARMIPQLVAAKREKRPSPQPQPKPVFKAKRMPLAPAPALNEIDAPRTEHSSRLYEDLIESADAMRDGDEDARSTWIECADSLVAEFRCHGDFSVGNLIKASNGFAPEQVRTSEKRLSPCETDDQAGEEHDRDVPIPSVEISQPTGYRDIAFPDWLDIFLEYALLLTATSSADAQLRCYNLIETTLNCGVWKHDSKSLLQIHLVYLVCALAFKDADRLYNVVLRWFLKTFAYTDDAYQLFAAISLVYPTTLDKTGKEGQVRNATFRSRAMRQVIFKQVVQMSTFLPKDYNPEGYGPIPDFMRKGGGRDKEDEPPASPASEGVRGSHGLEQSPEFPDDDEDQEQGQQQNQNHKLDEMNALLLLLFGHMLHGSGNGASSLSYFLRAYSLAPRNPVVLLSIALGYIHEIIRKARDNRHMNLLQGWAFFEEYADTRREGAKERSKRMQQNHHHHYEGEALEIGNEEDSLTLVIEQEIEFNRARCWHMLGMMDLALRSYQKVLAIGSTASGHHKLGNGPEEPGKHFQDFTREAAYAISTIYGLSGNANKAREVTEKYLVV